jgi:hypothetical protein
MLRATCPKLSAIAKVLREKYDLHFAMIAPQSPEAELRLAEAEVSRISRLMTNHRRIRKTRPSTPEAILLNLQACAGSR